MKLIAAIIVLITATVAHGQSSLRLKGAAQRTDTTHRKLPGKCSVAYCNEKLAKAQRKAVDHIYKEADNPWARLLVCW